MCGKYKEDVAQWLEHSKLNGEVLGSNPGIISLFCYCIKYLLPSLGKLNRLTVLGCLYG